MQTFEGGCLCGAIRYRISVAPTFSVICHCISCRRASGAAAVAWVTFDRAQFRFTTGFPQSHQSSAGVVRRFCGTCGTPLTYENASSASTVDVTTATLEDAGAFPPRQEVWVEHRVAWQVLDPALEHFPQTLTLESAPPLSGRPRRGFR